jgi:hypothetical protein
VSFKLDWPHVVIYGLLLGFVLALAFVALKASSEVAGSVLWPVIGSAAGALVMAGVALFRSGSATGQLARMKVSWAEMSETKMREADTVPPTPRNDNGKGADDAS